MHIDLDFYRNKNVFITGHTGFKGTWLCKILTLAGANITGYSLCPPTDPSLFELSGIEKNIHSVVGDIRDYDSLFYTFEEAKPEIVFHLAAQPLVRESYNNPKYTYETNVLGTVNILECVRLSTSVKSVLNVTTDKVYKNNEWCWGYREDEPLDGYDPYSNSKSCSELVTHSYKNSFFNNDVSPAISTTRAGNVIGGGDFATDRIIPDCIRSVVSKKDIIVRNPSSIRPYQHVLEPLFVYLVIAQEQYKNKKYAGYYNVGPNDSDCVKTGDLVDMFCRFWGPGATWKNISEQNAPHEANYLKLDCNKLKYIFNWQPKWNIEECLKLTCDFYKTWVNNEDINLEMEKEINLFLNTI